MLLPYVPAQEPSRTNRLWLIRRIEGCFTCRSRKVRCDGRPGVCARCERIDIECRWGSSPHQTSSIRSGDDQSMGHVTHAGHRRLRTSKACETCRKRKLKCDAGRPSCSTCLRHKSHCYYDMSSRASKKQSGLVSPKSTQSDRFEQLGQTQAQSDNGSDYRDVNAESEMPFENTSPLRSPWASERHGSPTPSNNQTEFSPLPSGQDLTPYLDSYFTCVHPICFQNILHPGILSEGFEDAPRVLLLAICGASAKFLSGMNETEKGRRWIAEAKSIIMRDLDDVSTLSIVVLQTIAMHDVHEAKLLSAWNLNGISIRMARQLKLNHQPHLTSIDPATFLEQECKRRLMWSVFVGDILLASDQIQISEDYVAGTGLPCNLWNFTQGTPCTTLRLHDDTKDHQDVAIRHATNPNGYLVRILALRRRIHSFIQDYSASNGQYPWLESSQFNDLVKELENFRRSLPANMKFEERHMYTFRTSHHLDMFLMIHVWYHACGYELFGSWVPGRPKSTARDLSLIFPSPPEFSKRCAERSLSHARQISCLLEKMIKVEPDRLFRDPWLSLPIRDSTLIQLAAYGKDEDVAKSSHYLRLNLRALANTRTTFAIADRTYLECCRVLQKAGLGGLVEGVVEGEADGSLSQPETHNFLVTSTIEILRRYPFLQPPMQNETKNWTQLFNATNFTGAMSRESTPESIPEKNTPTHDNLMFDVEFQSQPSMSDVSFLDEEYMQQFLPWQNNDFQWNETAGPVSTKASNAMPFHSVESTTGTSQNLLEPFANSITPKTRWNATTGFDPIFCEP